MEFREKLGKYSIFGQKPMQKTISDIDKAVQGLRLLIQKELEKKPSEDKPAQLPETILPDLNFTLTREDAMLFNKNTNMLHFIRKNILANECALFKKALEELKKACLQVDASHPAFMGEMYNPEVHD